MNLIGCRRHPEFLLPPVVPTNVQNVSAINPLLQFLLAFLPMCREHFRKGARMLVDEDDRELYLQALDPSFQPGGLKVGVNVAYLHIRHS